MPEGILFMPLSMIGIAAIAWGLPASHNLRPPLNVAAALAVLAGSGLFILGVLLTFIPDFFKAG